MAKNSIWIKYPKNFWKKTRGLLIILPVCFLFFGCVSTAPLFYTDNPKKDFTILGEVTYESERLAGYQDLLKAAKKKYAGCDYMIDVMVDNKTTVFLFWKFNTCTMRGTAIQYNK
jgi:hypothetical protein